MAITVNGDPHPHREGLTVEQLLAEKSFTWRLITVIVDGRRIPRDEFDRAVIDDGADVKVIHMMAGG